MVINENSQLTNKKTIFVLIPSVRVGSFNSAPKFNNIDAQDDDYDIPNSIKTAADLVNHCKLMRGDNRPDLLPRSFYKPPNDLLANDLTDGLRYLSLNSVSKSTYPFGCFQIFFQLIIFFSYVD